MNKKNSDKSLQELIDQSASSVKRANKLVEDSRQFRKDSDKRRREEHRIYVKKQMTLMKGIISDIQKADESLLRLLKSAE